MAAVAAAGAAADAKAKPTVVAALSALTVAAVATYSGCVVSTVAGAANQTGNADGVGSAARFQFPWGCVSAPANAYDPQLRGKLLVVDSENTLRAVDISMCVLAATQALEVDRQTAVFATVCRRTRSVCGCAQVERGGDRILRGRGTAAGDLACFVARIQPQR